MSRAQYWPAMRCFETRLLAYFRFVAACKSLIPHSHRAISRPGASFGLYDSMVHYNPTQKFAAQTPAPRCPKCGSHRTEIVGFSDDLKTVHVRCGVCGARSELPAQEGAAV
jgi:Zn finger protein HypA/HybF involved in hydrogenase expression